MTWTRFSENLDPELSGKPRPSCHKTLCLRLTSQTPHSEHKENLYFWQRIKENCKCALSSINGVVFHLRIYLRNKVAETENARSSA